MTPRRDTRSRAQADTARISLRPLLLDSAFLLGLVVTASSAFSQGDENITVSHGYSFFGDLKYPADYPHLNYVNPDAPKGGEIATWAPGTFDSFNPYTRKGRSAALSNIGDEDIVVTFADDPTAIYCLLCETMEYPESLDWVIFNLRPEVTFSDGTPAKAQDIEYAFNTFMTDGLPSFRAAFGSFIEKVEVLDDHTIKYTFAPASPPRDRIGLAGVIGPLSQTWFEENDTGIDQSRLMPHLGTGPYVLDSFDSNSRVVYKRNPNYWGNDLAQNVGRNNFDSIRIEYFADGSAAFEAFKAGAYTFRSENSSKSWATGYNFPALEAGNVIKTELASGAMATGQSFVFNLRREKFQDIRVREAVGLMFNFEWSNESLFFGLYERINSFWDNSDLEAVGVPSAGELALLQPLVDSGLLEASILTDDVVNAPTSSSRQLDRGNLRRASDLLDAAGWAVNDQGMREKDGQIFSIVFLESSPAFDRVINPYVENLKRLGIDASLNRVDPSQETELTRSFDFDMATHQMPMAFEPGTGLQQYFGSKAAAESSRNLMGLQDPAIDALIDKIVNALTKDQMTTGVMALDRVLRAKRFWVPQWFKDVHTVAYWDQFEHPDPLPPLARGEMDFWWFNADKAAALKASGALR